MKLENLETVRDIALSRSRLNMVWAAVISDGLTIGVTLDGTWFELSDFVSVEKVREEIIKELGVALRELDNQLLSFGVIPPETRAPIDED